MTTENKRSWASFFGYRLAVIVLALGLAGCTSLSGERASHPVVGMWATLVSTPQGDIPQTLTFNADMSGTVSMTMPGTPEEVTIPFSDVIVDGPSVSFVIVVELQFQDTTFQFQGTVDGDVLSGEFVYDAGTVQVTGKRI